MEEDENYHLGIDFGTTYSCVGVWKDDSVIIVPNGITERTTPSVVIFNYTEYIKEIYVGEETLNRVWDDNYIKIYEIKRLVGKKYSQVKDIIKYFSYDIIKGDNDEILIKIKDGVLVKPQDIVYLIINKLVSNVKNFLDKDISDVIITVPADFSDSQRNAIKSAAEKIAGIKVKKIINEPSAAVISYGIPKKFMKGDKKILNKKLNEKEIRHPLEEIYLGVEEDDKLDKKNNDKFIENFDIAKNESTTCFKSNLNDKKVIVFDLGGGTYDVSLIDFGDNIFETKASSGNTKFGGGDFDNRLMDYCIDKFCEANKNFSVEKIKKNNKCKQRLKIACEQLKKNLSFKTEDTLYISDFYKNETLICKITRPLFENICADEFKKILPPINKVLEDGGITPKEVNEIVLVGGSSRIPKIKSILKEKFPKSIINDSINPEEAVAYGATILSESNRLKIGDFWEEFDYMDAIQHSYGIEVDNGLMEIILKRGSKYPINNERYFFTFSDYQTNFVIKVYEGENKYVKNNEFIDEFIIENIPKKRKGEVCLSVTFRIDENQILNMDCYIADNNIQKHFEIKRGNKGFVVNTNFSANLSKYNENNEKEKKIKEQIIEYSKKYKNAKDNKEKYKLIKKYNEALIFIIKLFQKNILEIFNFIERLFQSFAYIYNNNDIFSLMTKEYSKFINDKITEYLEKIFDKNPFKLKEILSKLKNKNKIFYIHSIKSMDLLNNSGNEYFSKKDKNSTKIAKNIFEECLSIANDYLCYNNKEKNEKILMELDVELKLEFDEIVENCEESIQLILAGISIEYTKKYGKLFNNKENYDGDNLNLMHDEYKQQISYLKNQKNDDEKLEIESILYANLVKIELLRNEDKLDLNKLLKYAEISISKAQELGGNYQQKEWYKEIVQLKNEIEKKLQKIKIQNKNGINLDTLKNKLNNKFNSGFDIFLEYILKNYPINGYENFEEKIKEFKNNSKKFLKKLSSAYKKANKFCIDLNEDGGNINENFNEKKTLILEYINKCYDLI